MIPFITSLSKGNVTPPPIVADYDVFLVAGQSNSGQQVPTNEVGAPSYFNDNIVTGVYSYNNTSIVSDYSLGDTGANGNGWPYVSGASLSNRFTYKDVALYQIAQARPNRKILMNQVTNGGSTLGLNFTDRGSWNVDFANVAANTPLLSQLLEDKLNGLISFASNNNITLNIAGMLWHQGESGSPGADYELALLAFFNFIRIITNKPNLPIVTGTVANPSIRDIQLSVASNDPYIYCRNNDDLTFRDGVHYDAQSCVTFGNWAKDIVIKNI